MQWYSHLYVGKKAKRHRYAIIQGIREERLQPEGYVITSPQLCLYTSRLWRESL